MQTAHRSKHCDQHARTSLSLYGVTTMAPQRTQNDAFLNTSASLSAFTEVGAASSADEQARAVLVDNPDVVYQPHHGKHSSSASRREAIKRPFIFHVSMSINIPIPIQLLPLTESSLPKILSIVCL